MFTRESRELTRIKMGGERLANGANGHKNSIKHSFASIRVIRGQIPLLILRRELL